MGEPTRFGFKAQELSLLGIIQDVPGIIDKNAEDVPISGVASDSRKVKSGDVFVALQGGAFDGHDFIQHAVGRGAVAVLGTQPLADPPVPYVQVEDSRLALAYMSAALYGHPAQKLVVIGVTGTDGKTTTANLIYNILRAANLRVGMISTVNALIGNEIIDTGFHVTTPEAPEVQYYLARMVHEDLTHVVLEATSHGLAQHRVSALGVDIGVATNITHEHLDYHGTYEAYREAKGRLFKGLSTGTSKEISAPRGAVLNMDDGSYAYLASISKVPVITYGLDSNADVHAENITYHPRGMQFTARLKQPKAEVSSVDMQRIGIDCHLLGEFNVLNCLAAIAATYRLMGVDIEAVADGIATLGEISGRMENINMGQDFLGLVDFAHTPNALKNALIACRSIVDSKRKDGRIIVVFGSAGLRDRTKRRLMAEVSAELADITILTAEDPRTESLDDILDEMAESIMARGGVEHKTFWRIPDRGDAIRFGIDIANPGDLVIACGKGHEQSMCFGDVEYAWDDRIAMRAALAEYLGVAGPEMPYLPTQD
jgi:UDP-N-acetylmuramoyl-L-alanyl-D-glutamate--2,6-diaminopimelate ligase